VPGTAECRPCGAGAAAPAGAAECAPTLLARNDSRAREEYSLAAPEAGDVLGPLPLGAALGPGREHTALYIRLGGPLVGASGGATVPADPALPEAGRVPQGCLAAYACEAVVREGVAAPAPPAADYRRPPARQAARWRAADREEGRGRGSASGRTAEGFRPRRLTRSGLGRRMPVAQRVEAEAGLPVGAEHMTNAGTARALAPLPAWLAARAAVATQDSVGNVWRAGGGFSVLLTRGGACAAGAPAEGPRAAPAPAPAAPPRRRAGEGGSGGRRVVSGGRRPAGRWETHVHVLCNLAPADERPPPALLQMVRARRPPIPFQVPTAHASPPRPARIGRGARGGAR